MSDRVTIQPSQRQVLVNLGNRYVVFGPAATLPQASIFDPDKDSAVLPRVADESEADEEGIIETVKVAGFETIRPADHEADYDLIAQDEQGKKTLIEVKVRERDPKQRDLQQEMDYLKTLFEAGPRAEVWNFNIERLKLVIMTLDEGGMPSFSTLEPLDVWERTNEGVFRRSRVVERVEDWERRISELYSNIKKWLAVHRDLRTEQNRTVVMSEELMQKFAVPDRELPVLDVLQGSRPLLSFVPRALYIIGARGRIDIITESGTRLLVDQGEAGTPNWRLVSPKSRRETVAFDQSALEGLIASRRAS